MSAKSNRTVNRQTGNEYKHVRPSVTSWKGWLIFGLAFLSFPAWFAVMWWIANERSGWNDLVMHYGPASAQMSFPHKSAIIGVERPNGRRHVFADSDRGSYRRGKVDYGFDDTGFWMRGRYRGMTYGPSRSLFIPWSEVWRTHGLKIYLRSSEYRFYVQEQILLDAVEKYVQ